ncbi:ComF family protein [Halomonas sp. LS-001]
MRGFQGIRWLEKKLRQALPGHCAFCLGEPMPHKAWCQECFDGMPWNRVCCQRCAEPLTSLTQGLCVHCQQDLPAFASAHVPFLYRGPVRQLVHDFKFKASPRAGNLMVALYLDTLSGHAEWQRDSDVLVPVPLFTRRSRERGFNQSDWFARQLSQHLGLAVTHAIRTVDTPSQRLLGRSARRNNLGDVFQLTLASPARVILVDDVVTTGATVQSLASAAWLAGATDVSVMAFARTPLGAG